MIIKGSNFSVIDNTGARKVQCIQPLGKKSLTGLKVGDYIVVAIKRMEKGTSKLQLKVKKSDVCLAIIVKTKKPVVRATGITLKASINSVMLVSALKEPAGTRVNGLIYEEISRIQVIKDLLLSKDFI